MSNYGHNRNCSISALFPAVVSVKNLKVGAKSVREVKPNYEVSGIVLVLSSVASWDFICILYYGMFSLAYMYVCIYYRCNFMGWFKINLFYVGPALRGQIAPIYAVHKRMGLQLPLFTNILSHFANFTMQHKYSYLYIQPTRVFSCADKKLLKLIFFCYSFATQFRIHFFSLALYFIF